MTDRSPEEARTERAAGEQGTPDSESDGATSRRRSSPAAPHLRLVPGTFREFRDREDWDRFDADCQWEAYGHLRERLDLVLASVAASGCGSRLYGPLLGLVEEN